MSSEDASTVSRVEVKWVEDDLFLGSDEAGHSVVFDSALPTPTRTKPRPKGIGPMNALLTSLGACSGMDVAAILLKRKQRLVSLTVEVSGKRPKYGYPKPFTEIHLRYLVGGAALEEKYVKEAVTDSIKKFCSVAATINAKASVSFSYEIARA
ncbi:MAG TPA: OsmC family protein [Nitrososphaerales archaeon]|nr:OsmC family protein [Nitrososphaerales archaeon]